MKSASLFALLVAIIAPGCEKNQIRHYTSVQTIGQTEYRIDYGEKRNNINFLVLSICDDNVLDPSDWMKIESGSTGGAPFIRARLVTQKGEINLVNSYNYFEVVNGKVVKRVDFVPTKDKLNNIMQFGDLRDLRTILPNE